MQVIDGLFVPDPEGYPIWKNPRTEELHRCVSFFIDQNNENCYYGFVESRRPSGETLYWGLITGTSGDRYDVFCREELLSTGANGALEHDPEGLERLTIPFYFIRENGRDREVIQLERLDGTGPLPREYSQTLPN